MTPEGARFILETARQTVRERDVSLKFLSSLSRSQEPGSISCLSIVGHYTIRRLVRIVRFVLDEVSIMFITIDGFSGAGKSTQVDRLKAVVDGGMHELPLSDMILGRRRDFYAETVVCNEALEYGSLILAYFSHASQIISNPDKVYYGEDFWFDVCQGREPEAIEKKWVIFQNMLDLACVPKPDLSIFIDVPELVRDRRVVKRGGEDVTDSFLEILAMKEKTGVDFDGGHHMGIVCQDIIDRFHVIDGTQAVDKVTTDILELMRGCISEVGGTMEFYKVVVRNLARREDRWLVAYGILLGQGVSPWDIERFIAHDGANYQSSIEIVHRVTIDHITRHRYGTGRYLTENYEGWDPYNYAHCWTWYDWISRVACEPDALPPTLYLIDDWHMTITCKDIIGHVKTLYMMDEPFCVLQYLHSSAESEQTPSNTAHLQTSIPNIQHNIAGTGDAALLMSPRGARKLIDFADANPQHAPEILMYYFAKDGDNSGCYSAIENMCIHTMHDVHPTFQDRCTPTDGVPVVYEYPEKENTDD